MTCKTCKYAEFVLTPTGRVKRTGPGKCTFPFELPQIPESFVVKIYSSCIWQDDGANCPTYEKSHAGPTKTP